jgi:DUF4097 and DUF4098 domain-containing protein YvlB
MRSLIVAATLVASTLVATPAGAQEKEDNSFKWSGDMKSGSRLYAHNLNGSLKVGPGTGSKIEVTARKQWRRGNPDDVKIIVTQVGSNKGDLVVCALWKGQSSCDEDGYHGRKDSDNNWWGDKNDVSVEITIKVPAGVNIEASSVNGSVDVDGATAEVIAKSVNGQVSANSTGSVKASTVNGGLRVRTGAITSRTEFSSVNGSITLDIPADSNLDLEMKTVNGSLDSDFPLQVQGRINPKSLRASIGKGGPTLKLSTVNGSIRLRKA